jgi:hypothetical protein
MRPRNWPHLLIEDGPSIAGLSPGDAIALVPRARTYVDAVPWDAGRYALFVWTSSYDVHAGKAWRVDADGTLQHVDHDAEGVDAPWRLADAAQAVMQRGPWRLRFVGDGPPLATSKRFAEHLAVHAHHAHAFAGERARSEWILPADDARNILVVEEGHDGALSWFSEPRRIGVELEALRLAAAADGRARSASALGERGLDREVAAGIVAQLTPGASSIVGFDGVVRAIDGSRSTLDAPPLDVYALLTRGRAAPRSASARSKLEKELTSTRAASPHDIAQVVVALCPDAWAREQALVEECGILGGAP